MPKACELKPGDGINHPTTGNRVEFVDYKHIKSRKLHMVLFKAVGVKGWFRVPGPDHIIETNNTIPRSKK